MANARRLPWYATATEDERLDLAAKTWRRNAEAAVFRADTDPSLPGKFSEVVSTRMKGGAAKPTPKDPALADAEARFRAVERETQPKAKTREPFNVRELLERGYERRQAEERQAELTSRPYIPGPEDALDIGTGGRTLRSLLLNPSNPVEAVRESLDPSKTGGDFQLRNMGGIRNLSDRDVIGSLSLRDIVGGVADIAADPATVAAGVKVATKAGPAAARGLRGVIEAADESAARTAIRNVEGPIESSTRGVLSRARALPDDVARVADDTLVKPEPGAVIPAGRESAIARGRDPLYRPVLRGAADTPENDPAIDALRNFMREEDELRLRKVPEREIQRGRGRQASNFQERMAEGRAQGLTGKDLADYASGGFRTGPLRETMPSPVEITALDKDRIYNRLNAMADAGDFSPFEYRRVRDVLGNVLEGRGSYQPADRNLLARLLGDEEVANRLADRAVEMRRAPNVRPNVGMKAAQTPPGAARPPRESVAARISQRVRTARDKDLAKQAADELKAAKAELDARRSRLTPLPSASETKMQVSAQTGRSAPSPGRRIAISSQKERAAATAAAQREAERAQAAELAARRARIPSPPPRGVEGAVPPSGRAPSIRQLADQARDRARARMGIPKPKDPSTFWQQAGDVLNIPRSAKSTLDISAPFRQGAVLSARNPQEFWGSWAPMVKSLGSEAVAEGVDRELRRGRMAVIRERVGLYMAPLKEGALSQREEAFMSRMAERVPGVEQSQRAYVTFLNKLRADVFDKNYERLVESGLKGKELDDAAKELAKFLNAATGRGDLKAGDLTSALTNLFFSPRLLKSRFDVIRNTLPTHLGGNIQNDLVRQIARENVGAWMGQNLAILTLLGVTGVAAVELDPRSSEWGKIRVGGIRIDPWAGFQQIGRATAQALTGERKTSAGDIVGADRGGTAVDFARGRLNPGVGILVDQYTGETMLGDELDSAEARAKNVGSGFIPLFPQDIAEAIREEGLVGGVLGILGGVGFGVQAYHSLTDVRDEVASELFQKPFDRLNRAQKEQVDADGRVVEQFGEVESDTGTPQQRVSIAFDRLREVNAGFEDDLAHAIAAGAEGEQLRQAISDFKGRRYDASQTLISPEIEQAIAKSDQPVEDMYAERYWSASREPDPLTGRVDFDAIEAERQQILSEAQAAGVDPEYILGSGSGTFRGTRFENPAVREAVEDYEDFQRSLGERGFWDIDRQTWEELRGRIQDPQLASEAAQYGSFEEYRDDLIEQLAGRLETQGMARGVAIQRAEAAVGGHDLVQAYSSLLQRGKSEWLQANPDLAERTIADGYISPSMLNIRSAVGTARPTPTPQASSSLFGSGTQGGGLFGP